ncbi:MAG: glycoside hydrolase family 3 C-terminal domain-containing protein [Treponema sp.]|nr:glycoside hydrolase family 3 C-terminal domain-containing protein [Treponema sp.]
MALTAEELLAQMTLEEKASLCSGRDFWTLKEIKRLGLSSIMVTDGPHGLRKQAGASDHLGLNQSVPATCFPTASATACSFDRELLEAMGRAMAEEYLQEGAAVILGPGANIKRSPLCGRNFEYISEDPYVSGELAAALILGAESQGVGTSLKHYAVNNQEQRRMVINAVVDERALREIYLAGFERAVKKAQPWTVMCSYNRADGIYLSENKRFLSDILRDEWGFEGLVMTDWGATNDRVAGVKAGLDLEMPGSGGRNDAKIVEALKKGLLEEAELDRVVLRVIKLILKAQEAQRPGYRYDAAAHQALARRAARESAVLLKNEGVLPVAPGAKTALIGALAKQPRYQGAGSSRVNPSCLENAYDALTEAGLNFEYAPGYSLAPGSGPDPRLIEEACAAARGKDRVLIFAGLPDEYESEGFDRHSLAMPESHVRLIEAVAKENPRTAVILQCGAPVSMPWASQVQGILLMYLGGQAGGGAAADLITGKASPSGKLAETFPLSLEDNPSYAYFPGGKKTVEYRESIFVGYRYYDALSKETAYPFGYGLSYTQFAYEDLRFSAPTWKEGETVEVSLQVRNIGACPGAEIVQLYAGLKESRIFRAVKELKGFEKVFLQPGEAKRVGFTLDARSFAYYNTPAGAWAVEGGDYLIQIGASSRDIRLERVLPVEGDGKEELLAYLKDRAPSYYSLPSGRLEIPDADFEALYGKPLPPRDGGPGDPFTINSTLSEITEYPAGKQLYDQISAQMTLMLGEDNKDVKQMIAVMVHDMPLRGLAMFSQGHITPEQMEGLVALLNRERTAGA